MPVWETLPEHHPVLLDTFQIMPNHVHFVIAIVGVYPVGAGRALPAKDIINETNDIFFRVWQRNYLINCFS